ncbi:DinB family protein [Mucilaginibacter sp. KACC 22063]|uniref:DinB family protein n=1 Tax=Mucilaginibacter sp. KACC 22063 TaxID=3025666 RepID=UPI0023673850|nr:DinB family protein [Mucilaginibacter sp. KACC 22063]WDF55865.1 DinB family protein [Mucilaginibacter sp. KACC 22063]
MAEGRRQLLGWTKELTENQYNFIPPGFNNNIIWNMGHLLVVSESLLYQNTPQLYPVYEFTNSHFEKGSKPNKIVNEAEI